jgi:uncharacterized small protein (DUF1192 family)
MTIGELETKIKVISDELLILEGDLKKKKAEWIELVDLADKMRNE